MTDDNNYTLDDEPSIKKVLRELPLKIKNIEEKIMGLETNRAEFKLKNDLIEAQILDVVTKETVDAKPVFSNKEKRDTETERRAKKSEEYMRNRKVIEERVNEIITIKIQYSYLKRINSNAGNLARINGRD